MASREEDARPRTRQRVHKPAPALDVPDIDKDAAERKRVLNVLAQRRYRERKRNDRLKAKAKRGGGDEVAAAQDSLETQQQEDQGHNDAAPAPPSSLTQSLPEGGVALPDLELTNWDWDANSHVSNPSDPSSLSGLSDIVAATSASLPEFSATPETLPDAFAMPELFSVMDPSQGVFSISNSPTSFNTSPSSSSTDFEFTDSYHLPVHELTLLKAMLRISNRLGVDSNRIWDLECPSPFTQGGGTPSDQLPVSWRPTASQISIPHHPVLDLIPWPFTRDRILMFLNLPDEARPPTARGPMAMINFMYDLEDNCEGVRIYGSDPCDADGWEVGQKLFERWWFVFDRDIIANSNRWREVRGAPPLQIKAE